MKLSAILLGAAVASDYDYDALGNKKQRMPSLKGQNCWAKYESTCDFLPNNDGTVNNAADQTGPSGLVTLTHMQCDGGYTYVKLTGDLSCPGCDSNRKNKHGFHVHEKKTQFNGHYGPGLANDCSGAVTGKHFHIAGEQIHGPLNGANSHNGAMGNVIDDNGHIHIDIENEKISLDPRDDPHYIGGRSLSMHKNFDEENTDNDPLGNAGPRIGCCNISPAKHFCKERHASCKFDGVAKGTVDITEVYCKDDHSWINFSGDISCPNCHDGEHGFHVHQGKTIFDANKQVNCHPDQTMGHFSDGDDNGMAGGTLLHGHHDDPNRHYGAIANLQKCPHTDIFKVNVTDGEDREEPGMSLSAGSIANIDGRTMVLHAKRDMGRELKSDPADLLTYTGSSGPRIGCCEIKSGGDGPGPDPVGWCGIKDLNKYFGVGKEYVFNCKAGKSKCAIKCKDGKKKCSPKKMKCKNGKPSISKVSGC